MEYYHLFGEIVHSETALKLAHLKAMSYQFCCIVQVLGKSPNQLPPNFKSWWTVASEAFFTFIGPIYIYLARTPEIGQGLGRILSCGARKPEHT